MYKGTVLWYNNSKGFGFISTESGANLFLHCSQVSAGKTTQFFEGDLVEFELGNGRKGEQAVNVRKLSKKQVS